MRGSWRRTGFGQVLDVEQPLEDPVVQPRLAQLVAVEDRPDALPALLQEAAQRVDRLRRRRGGRRRAGCPVGAVDAEPALARPHAEPQAAADVVEVRPSRGGASPPRAARARSARTRRSAARPAASPRAAAAASRARRSRRPRCPAGAPRPCGTAGSIAELLRTSRRRGPAPSAAGWSACRPTSSAGRRCRRAARWSTTACVRLTSRVSLTSPASRVLEQRPHARPHAQRARLPEARGPAARRRRASGRPPPASPGSRPGRRRGCRSCRSR